MIMTIDEAIAHAKEVAEKNYLQGMLCHANPNDSELDRCIECGREHEQLTEWLQELKLYREIGTLEEVKDALARKIDNVHISEWIPCSERMPEEHEETKDIFDIHTLTVVDTEHHMVSDLVIVTVYDYDNDKVFVCNDCTVDGKWCNFPESSDTYDVLAWMPLPEPYKEG